MVLAKGMDPLGDVSDDSDDSDAEGAEEEETEAVAPPAKKLQVDYETLSRCGYKSGPSVLLIPDKPNEASQSYTWGKGERGDEEEESAADREATRAAIAATEQAASNAIKAAEFARQQKQDAYDERQQMRQDNWVKTKAAKDGKNSLFNQKEKRKRDLGQASRGKNYVEEEKRILRQSGGGDW